ncbi:NAD(P)/FAD-dependent oxidoreductase [Haloechinothrix sp. LS1_15]|uniref:flavin-containing monooxygenase n=1 Tax=Haloechinothrix sp. LS1_15 TaxID=2652248 RepID=UPI00294B5ACA|nr:NAD(P)/FAD-dependent oxidoreductase [Haloechinothrix sp. LS1_15]
MPRDPSVIVIGAGMSGIGLAVKLKHAGITDVTVLEKADDIGGTWRDNTYPGLKCDVPSAFYQFWFDRNPDWSHFFSHGAEIHRYFRDVVDRHRLWPHIHLGTEVTSATFSENRWRVTTADGAVREADFLVSATGVLHRPVVPDIPGRDAFTGAAFHSARWDHSIPLAGKRVGVIGTGSTGMQIVTALAGEVGELTLFQRTPQWVLPIPNWRNGRVTRRLRCSVPGATALEYRLVRAIFGIFVAALIRPGWQRRAVSAACRAYLRTVGDPELRRKLTPDYQPMCKRLVICSGFYRAVQHPDVHLAAEGIERIEPSGVATTDGRHHELDVLVFATGFDSHAYLRPVELTGPDGRTLSQEWAGGARAYRTVALPGFPNFFMLMGPHSPVGNFSLIPVAEVQADYVIAWIQRWRRGEFTAAAPTAEATDTYNAWLRAAMPDTVWTTGCDSWYLGPDGTPEVWPLSPQRHAAMLRQPHTDEFTVV